MDNGDDLWLYFEENWSLKFQHLKSIKIYIYKITTILDTLSVPRS